MTGNSDRSEPPQQRPDQLLIRQTVAYALIAAVLVPLWIPFDYLLDRGHFYLFTSFRIAFVTVALGAVIVCLRIENPVRYYRAVGMLVYLSLIAAILPMVIMTDSKYPYYLGFSTVFFGTSILMIWPLRFMFLPMIGTGGALALFEWPNATVRQATVSIFLMSAVGLISLLASWLTYKNYRSNQALVARLNDLTLTDQLTGLNNRRAFDIHLARELARAERNGTPVSVLMIDVDYFKAFNDNYGHQKGDECLSRVADCLRRGVIRRADFIARYGGEEFAVILPDTDERGAERAAERVTAIFAEERIDHAYSPAGNTVTVSIGVACREAGAEQQADQLVACADAALYDAKTRGRARYVIYGPDNATAWETHEKGGSPLGRLAERTEEL